MRNNNPDEQGIGDTSLWIQQFQGEDSGIPSYENIKFEEESKFIPQPPPESVLSISPKTFIPKNPSELESKQTPDMEVAIQSESGLTTIPFKPVGVNDIIKGRYKRDLKNFILNNINQVAGPKDITAGNLGVVAQASVPTDDFLSVFLESISGADGETHKELSGFMLGIVSQAGNIRFLTDKVNNNPDDTKSRSELGSLYASLGLNDEARNLLTYSAAKGDAAAMYGLAFLEANDSARYASMPIDKANEERETLVRSYLDDAIKADPKMVQPRIFKASLDTQDGNYKGAEEQVAAVISSQPINSVGYSMMADLKKKSGDSKSADFYKSLASVFSTIPDEPYFFDQDLITGRQVKTAYQIEREAQSKYMASIADALEMKGILDEDLSMSEKLLAFLVNPFAVILQSTFQTGEHTVNSIRNLAEHLPSALYKSIGGGIPYFNQDGVGDSWLKVAADAAHIYFGMYMLKAPAQDMMWKAMPEPVQKVFFEPITTGLSVAGDLSKLFEGDDAAAGDLAKRFGEWAHGVEKDYMANPDDHPLVGFLNTAASVALMGAMHKNGPDLMALPGQMKISRYLKMPEIQKVVSELTIGEVQDYQRLAKSKPSGISQSKWMKILPSLIEMEIMKKSSEGAPDAMKAVYKQRMKDHQSFVESVLGMSERVAEKATGPGREAILTKAGPMDVAEVIVGSRRAQAEKELQSSRESITKKLISGEELSPEEIDSFEKARNQMAPVRANERRAMRRRKFNLGSERAEFLSGAKKAIEKISGRKVVDDLELFIEAANQELPKKFGGDKAVFDTVRKQFVVTKEGNEVARVNLDQVNGFNRSGVSFINPEAAKADTPVHEILAHPAVDKMLEESGMTADQIMEADPSSLNEAGRSLREAFDFIEGTEYFNELSFNDAYKNDTKGNRLYEALVTAVGEEGQKLVTPDLKQRVINFGNKVMSALGLTMDSKIGEITKGVLSKSSTSASPAFSVEPKNYEYVTPAKRDSEGKIPPLQGVPKSSGGFGPDEKIVSIAEKYAEENKIPYKRQAEYVKIDEDRSRRIAEEYEKMKHDPQNPKVKEAYESLIEQTKKQYDALVADGYSFTFFDSKTDPYKGNPWEAVNDLRANKKMAVYGTYDGFGTEGITDSRAFDNPLLGDSGLKWPDQNGVMRAVTYNDLFRAVHDAFGHLLEGAGFRARGEENAWQAHARLFTGPAVGAMTSETRGQNSWLNFGPYGEKNRTAKVEDTVFGEQKVGLMPEWTWKEGLAGDEPSFSVEPVEATAKALEVINEKKISEKINQAYLDYAKKVQSLKDRINNLRKQEGDSDRVEKMMEDFFNMRDIERQLKTLSEQGALNMTVEETDRFLDDIKNGLGKTKYTRGKIIGKNNELGDLFAAEGDGVLYRSVTLDDWERIQKQGFVDSDKRGAISEQEGTNLAIDPRTSLYYLPHNQKGVIIAIDPKGVDLFMIKNDDYLRTNSKIPISNVVKVSEVIGAGDISGKYLPSKGKKQLSEAYHRAKADGTNPELVKAVEDLLGKPSAAKEPTQATEQPTEKETMVGKTVTFEHAGSEKSGVVKQIDNDGNYKVEGVSGGRTYNYTVKPKDATVEPSSPAKEYFSEPSEEAEFEIERVRNASGEDGSTFNLDGSSFSGKVISIPILSKNIKQEELTDQAIKDFVAEKSGSIVDSEMVKPGIYRFPDRPEVSIDLNVIVDPSKRDLAVEFARRAGQESVYDMSEGRSIKTGETGENPVNFTDQQFEIIQEALGKGEMPDVFDGKFSIEPGGDTPRKITFTEIEREWSNIETPKGRKVKTVVNLSTGVKLTEEQAAERKSLVDKIKKEAYKASREGFIDYLGRLKSDGTLRGVIPAKVLTKFTKSVMKIKDDDSYRAAVETLSKIIEDKEYAESIDAIQSLKESVASRMKGDKATYGDQTDSVRQLISIDEYSLSDLNAYHEMLSALDSKVPDIKKASELSEIVMRDASEANDWGQQNDLSEFIRGEIGKLAALPSEQERARGVKELFDSLTDKVLGMKEGDDGILRPTKIESIEDYRARSRAMSTISRVLRQASGLDPQSHEDLVRRIEEAQENFDSNDVLGDFKAEVERFKKQIAVEARGYFDVTDLSGLEPEFRDSVSRIFRAGDDVLSKLGVNDLENLRKAAYQLESGFFSPELFKISARVESVKRGSEIAKMLDETYSDRRVARLISKSKPEEIKDILRTGQKSEADVAVLAGKRSPYARFVKGFIERAWTSNESDTRKATKRYWDVAKKMKEDDRSVVGMILSQLDYQYNRPDFADLPAGEKDLYGYLLSQQRRNSAMPIQEVERIYKLAKPYLDEIVHSGADGLMLSGNKKLLYDIIREINQDLYKKNRVAALRRGKIIGTEEMYFKRVDRSEASSRTRFQADLESITDVINAMTSGYTLTSSATKARSSNGLYWREYNPDMVMLKAIREANRDYHLSDEVGVSLNALKYSESNASSQEAKDVSSYLHTMTFEGLRTELSNYASIHQSGGVLGGFWGSMSGTASTIVLADPVSRAIKEVTSNMSKWLLSRGLKPEISAKDYFNAIAFRRSESIQKLIDQFQVPILLNSQRYSVDVGRTGKEGKLKSISQAAGSMFDAWNKRAAFEAEFPAAFKKVSGKEFDDQAFLSDPEYATKNYDQIQEAVNIANMEVERITGPGSSFGSAEVASLFGAGRESGMFKLMAWMQHYNMIESRSLSNNMFDLIYNTNNGRTSAALNLAGLLASQVSYQMTSMIARSFYTGFGVKTYNDLSDEKKKQIDRLFSIEGFRDNLATSGINLTVGKYGNTMKIAVGLLGGFFDNYVKKAGDKELKEKWDQARNSAFDYFYVKPINFGEGFGATTAMDLIDILPIVPVVVSPLLEFLSGKPYLVDDVITKVMSGQDLTNDEEVAAYQAMVVINNFLPAVTQSVFKKDMLYPIQGTVYKWLREQKRESVKENKEQKKAAKGVKIRARRSPKKSSPDPAEPGFDTGAMEPSSSE